jgi:hypothetical protein
VDEPSVARAPRTVAPATPVVRGTQIIASVLAMLGIAGLLRTGLSTASSPEGQNLFVFPTHPVTASVQLLVGLTGIAAATSERASRLFLAGLAALMLAWSALGLALDGDPNAVFARDAWLVGMNAAIAAVALLLLAVGHGGRGGPGETPPAG